MTKISISLAAFFLMIQPFFTALAETEEKKDNVPSGVAKIDENFQIFPVNKIGNTIYLNNKKVVSRPDLILLDILEAPEGYVYGGIDHSEKSVIGYTGAPGAEIIPLDGEFYQLITEKGIKKIYRLDKQSKIRNMLAKSNTASGLVFNQIDKAAFFHIAKGETIETEDGKKRYLYTFKLHIVDVETATVKHLPEKISDFTHRLKLEWENDDTLRYTLSDEQTATITIR
ncbi:MAG: hypothetical protein GY866_25415 [Proteobacteria bacterium]|nr:hypothetical protein [Pseudomonadota bacterium]